MGRAATRSGLACVLGCLLVLAGCDGLAGNEDGTGPGSDSGGSAGTVGDGARASVTLAPVPTVENTTSGGTTFAPGLTESGITGPDALFVEYSSVGWTIIPRPPWYDAAIAATNETTEASEEAS